MINPVSQLVNLLPMVNQEGNAQPGEGLTALETFTYFFAAPIGIFAPKVEQSEANKDIVNHID
jgi:hypothetical protein